MPHPIIEIDELLGLVIDELVETSPQTAVRLALTCRSLEEPTLSSLWEQQHSLINLVKVLPNHTWVQDEHDIESITIEHDPSAASWARLQRYASWMRGLHLGPDGQVTEATISRLSTKSPGGVLCAKLEWLHWDLEQTPDALASPRLFLSPHLKRIILNGTGVSFRFPGTGLASLVRIISFLPTSLEDVTIVYGLGGEQETVGDAVSAFICQCGPLLRISSCNLPLSEAALHHTMQLPGLRSWLVVQGPPRTIPLSIFPTLEDLRIQEPAALPWLHLLASHEDHILQNEPTPATSHANTRETLKTLEHPKDIIIDSTLLSSILKFRNLVTLCVGTHCFQEDSCTFHLTDDDVENLAVALPRLECLQLGQPCYFNSCATTVASLLSISVHCLGLTVLEIHFNMLTIVSDMRGLVGRGLGRNNARCGLQGLMIGQLPFGVGWENIQTVAMGFKVIFPCLMGLMDSSGIWYEVGFILEDWW